MFGLHFEWPPKRVLLYVCPIDSNRMELFLKAGNPYDDDKTVITVRIIDVFDDAATVNFTLTVSSHFFSDIKINHQLHLTKSRWVLPRNNTITECRQTHGT